MEIISNSLQDTDNLAKSLAKKASPGAVFALTGDLGAGKTAFSKAFAKALGITAPVSSPTFTILNIYEEGRLPLYHFDCYRIEDPDEMQEIGFEEFIYGKGICLIEWADIIKDSLPLEAVWIKIEVLSENSRRIIIED